MSFVHAEVKTTTKKPEMRHNSVSQIKMADYPQSASSTVDRFLHLQRCLGNQAVQRLIESGRLQAKLRFSQPNDVYEEAADKAAEQIMRMQERQFSNETNVSRLGNFIQHGNSDNLRKEVASGATPEIASGMAAYVGSIRGGGQPLPESVRPFFELRFGHPFDKVRLHADEKAREAARMLNAKAFTIGHDIAFGSGQYAPTTSVGKQLLGHELAHVLQQENRGPILCRQTSGAASSAKTSSRLKQLTTKGIALERRKIEEWATFSYWDQRINTVYRLVYEENTERRIRSDPEERDAVLSTLWRQRPKAAVSSETKRLVSIPKRAKARGSKDLVYMFGFKPRKTKRGKPLVEVVFVKEGAVAETEAKHPPPTFTQQGVTYNHVGFPRDDARKYWKAHREEERRVFYWIQEVTGQTFDQVLTTSIAVTRRKKETIRKSVFHVKGEKLYGKITKLIITFLGSNLPEVTSVYDEYSSRDFADLKLEELQKRKRDKLGTINGLSNLPVDEQLSVKHTIWQYFFARTRNAEVDAIIPIANSTKRVLYTLRFRPKTNDVDVERIGEATRENILNGARIDIAHARDYNIVSKDVPTLTTWLASRYPHVKPNGKTVDEIRKNANDQIRNEAGTAAWFKENYGIEILSGIEGAAHLKKKHRYSRAQTADMKDFNPAELRILESTLETMSDNLITSFRGVYMVRQKVRIKRVKRKFVKESERGGWSELRDTKRTVLRGKKRTVLRSTERTVIIFDAAKKNDPFLFMGGKGTGADIDVYPFSAMTFAHELGHFVGWRPKVQKAFANFMKKKHIKPPTWYAQKDPRREFFPEAFALYELDPEWLKTNLPELYQWLDVLAKTGNPPARK